MSLAADDQFILLQSKDGISVPFKVERAEAADDLIILAKTADGQYVPMKVVRMDSADDQGFLVKTADGVYVPVKSQGLGELAVYSVRSDSLYRYGQDTTPVAFGEVVDTNVGSNLENRSFSMGGTAESGFYYLGNSSFPLGFTPSTWYSRRLHYTNDNGDTTTYRAHNETSDIDIYVSGICPVVGYPGRYVYMLTSTDTTKSETGRYTIGAYITYDYGATWSSLTSLINACDVTWDAGASDHNVILPGTLNVPGQFVGGSSGVYNLTKGFVAGSGYEIFVFSSSDGVTWSRTDLGNPGGNDDGGTLPTYEILNNQYFAFLDAQV